MDVERAEMIEGELDILISRRADKSPDPDELEESYKESVRRHRERIRRVNRAEWYSHFSALADSLRRSADAYEARALALLGGPGEGGP